MIIKASSKFIRISPRKTRLAADLIRHYKISEALSALKNLPQKAAGPLLKVLKQAVANSVNNYHLSKDSLSIKTVEINGGPVYKRFQPVSRGRAHAIRKQTSHISVVLESEAKHGTKS